MSPQISEALLRQGYQSLDEHGIMRVVNHHLPRSSSQPHSQRDEDIRTGLPLQPDTRVSELNRVREGINFNERELSRLPRASEQNSIMDNHRIKRHKRMLKNLKTQETRLLLMAEIARLCQERMRLSAEAEQARKGIECINAERAQLLERAGHVMRKRKREAEGFYAYSDATAIALSHKMTALV
jgi:hypothetical protein